MRIISSSKKGHNPILSIFQNKQAVANQLAMDSIEEILPIFLKKVRVRKKFIQSIKHFVIE